MRGQTIKLYISGEDQKNLKTAELGNWTGKAYIGLRKHISILQKNEELSTPGLYFLISEIDDSYQREIYIGEADEINSRLNDHYIKKDWWTDFVAFISKDTNLTKAHVRYLERYLYEIAIKNKTTILLLNSNTPTGSKLPKSDLDDMNAFAENIIFVLKNLGIIDFTKTNLNTSTVNNLNANEIFSLSVSGAKGELTRKANLTIVNGSYNLLAGSSIKKSVENKIASHNYVSMRSQLEKDGYYDESDSPSFYVLNKDIEFSSPSAAGAIVRNSSINGRKEWKLSNGISLDDYENAK